MPTHQRLKQSKQKTKQETETRGSCQPARPRKASKDHCSEDLFETKTKQKKKFISNHLQKLQRTLHKRKTQPKVSS